MKKINLALILLFIATLPIQASTVDSLLMLKVHELAKEIQKKYAPDKRVEYFQLNHHEADQMSYTVESTRPEAISAFNELLKDNNIRIDLSEVVFPMKELDGKEFGVANLSVINNRYAPGHSGEMATQSLLGTPVKILKKSGGFYFVRTPDNYLSWTESAGIRAMNKADFESWSDSEKIVYTDTYGHAFAEASLTAAPVSDLVAGNILQLIGISGRFYNIAFPDGRKAYIPIEKAQAYAGWVKRPNPNAAQILTAARTLLGVPYLWGGTSSKGVDCSGFTKNSYFLNGIVLPRDASQQALVGEPVEITVADTLNIDKALRNLKAGDLLFFAADKRNGRVTHTAIYIGEGEFIHAAGLVRINSMLPSAANYADFQSRTLVSARRMLTAIGQPGVNRIDQHPYYNLTD